MRKCEKRNLITAAATLLVALGCVFPAAAFNVSNRYRSPRNPERKVRASTELIVLHTTEAPAKSSLNKVSDRGECHFCVTEDGTVYRIVDRDREAFHAGRSMWNGREDVDKFSVGIEVVGYHNRAMGKIQLYALRDLVKELKAMYRIPDERVVCHSHVAYGAPNRWQKHRHRGRKRCGMLFAMPSVRRILELKARPAYDADTRSRRLTIGDPYLQTVLYGSVDTMRSTYGGGAAISAKVKSTPSIKPKTAAVATSSKVSAPTTVASLKAQGYVLKGTISKSVTAHQLAGGKWNSTDTCYVIRGKVTPGNKIDAAHLEAGMGVWVRK